jgi:hypothetical protein
VLRRVSILTDHHQGVGLYLVKVTELFKTMNLIKILKFNPGVVAAIHVAGVRGDPCGVVRWTAVQRTAPQGSPRTPATCIATTTPGLNFRILNSVF